MHKLCETWAVQAAKLSGMSSLTAHMSHTRERLCHGSSINGSHSYVTYNGLASRTGAQQGQRGSTSTELLWCAAYCVHTHSHTHVAVVVQGCPHVAVGMATQGLSPRHQQPPPVQAATQCREGAAASVVLHTQSFRKPMPHCPTHRATSCRPPPRLSAAGAPDWHQRGREGASPAAHGHSCHARPHPAPPSTCNSLPHGTSQSWGAVGTCAA